MTGSCQSARIPVCPAREEYSSARQLKGQLRLERREISTLTENFYVGVVADRQPQLMVTHRDGERSDERDGGNFDALLNSVGENGEDGRRVSSRLRKMSASALDS